MQRTAILLLVACAVLAVGSAAGVPARAAQPAGAEWLREARPAGIPVSDSFIYLPLVMRNSREGGWETVVEEGFESPPGSLWEFTGQEDPAGNLFTWGSSVCRPYTGGYSAWAVGHNANGASLLCGSDYPDHVDSRMTYGPFSLADATAADLRFRFWLYRGDAYDRDEFCWSAGSSSAELQSNELCLTFDTGAWSPMTLDLREWGPNAINLLGRPQVWIAFRFTSYGSGSQAEGAFVDDVVVRRCAGGTCPPAAGSVPASTAGRAERSPGLLPATPPAQSYDSGR
jgi:hypothetical protein